MKLTLLGCKPLFVPGRIWQQETQSICPSNAYLKPLRSSHPRSWILPLILRMWSPLERCATWNVCIFAAWSHSSCRPRNHFHYSTVIKRVVWIYSVFLIVLANTWRSTREYAQTQCAKTVICCKDGLFQILHQSRYLLQWFWTGLLWFMLDSNIASTYSILHNFESCCSDALLFHVAHRSCGCHDLSLTALL